MESIKKNEDFRRCCRTGKSWADQNLVLYVVQNQMDHFRIGISVSKKVGNSVVRHRVKRLVRECARLHERDLYGPADSSSETVPCDLVVIARRSASSATYGEIETSLLNLMRRSRLLRE